MRAWKARDCGALTTTGPTPHGRYVWKLVYIHMLGYDVDFGHMEIISLLTSTKFSEASARAFAIGQFAHARTRVAENGWLCRDDAADAQQRRPFHDGHQFN